MYIFICSYKTNFDNLFYKLNENGDVVMQSILHPVSGENGYFVSTKEKEIIDAILTDFKMNQLLVTQSSHNVRGGFDE